MTHKCSITKLQHTRKQETADLAFSVTLLLKKCKIIVSRLFSLVEKVSWHMKNISKDFLKKTQWYDVSKTLELSRCAK